MSVLKSKRKASQFEVFHHLTKMRKEITDLLLRDFGYSFEKAESRLVKRFGGKTYEELNEAADRYAEENEEAGQHYAAAGVRQMVSRLVQESLPAHERPTA